MFQNNLKIALRNLLRRRTFSAINIAGLGLGMAAAIFAFLWVQNEFSFDRYHQHAANLYRINTDLKISPDETWHWATTPMPLVDVLKEEVPEVLRTALVFDNFQPASLKKNATLLRTKRNAYVGEGWFDLFDYQFLSGSADGFSENLRSAILTRDLAERLFGRYDVTGETFRLDSAEMMVQAVVENPRPNSSFNHELLMPLSYYLSNPSNRENSETWDNFNFVTYVELRPGNDLLALGKKLTALVGKHKEDENMSLTVQPLAELHFDEERSYAGILAGSRSASWAFAFIGLIILFLACVNYVSITTAQAGMRTKEVGVRKIIGAGGAQIFRLLFAESLLTTLISLVLALCIVQAAMPFFNGFTEKNFQLDPADPAIWWVLGATSLATLALSGIYPALFLTGFSPGNFLRGQSFLKMKNTAFRKGLVVAQFAVTVGLIIGAIVILQQQDFIRKKDLGYDRSQVFEFTVPCCDGRVEAVRGIKQALANKPEVMGVSASNMSITNMQSTHSGSIDYDGKPDDFVPAVSQASVDEDFSELLKLPLADGRWFRPNNEADLNNVLLNESAVRLFNLKEPVVGQKFSFQGREGQVIGVVKDFNYQSLRRKIEPMVLSNYPPSNGNVMVKTAAGKAPEAIAAAQSEWEVRYPDLPFEYQFLDDRFDALYRSEQKNADLFQLLAGLAVFISCLGLFGLAVFSTEQRRKEIGVRKVLGASVTSVAALLSKDFLRLVILSLAIASPLAYYFMNKWLSDFAYRIDIQWWVFVLAGVLAVGVAFLTVGFQSVKAALANPVKSLRSE
ncbi:MAG: ABC transporter permease [Saprospiraceae bacterium]|nr:ABC transporter permease [Saprospiraceae bacterium]MCF8248565.1 ABC transporter permease [Saprospiraceae bacterium]MCF8280268.1 ABC transporter permease [Bacteroidales bacterium]MCF8310298.1 ABC transporter permease [Saprospiraceae bacterium]MCF8439262.1 ABC transporter permease [Saprospiraceae bacterium]